MGMCNNSASQSILTELLFASELNAARPFAQISNPSLCIPTFKNAHHFWNLTVFSEKVIGVRLYKYMRMRTSALYFCMRIGRVIAYIV